MTARLAAIVIAALLWPAGIWLVALEGRYVLGGALVVAAGLVLILAAGRGWSSLWEGVTNWIFFWR